MAFLVVDGSQFTHLSTDLPLPIGQGVPRGATSQELDTGRILRYDYTNGVWYSVGSGSASGGAVTNSQTAGTGSVTKEQTVADLTVRDTLDEIRQYLKAQVYALALLKGMSFDELMQDSADA